MWKDQKIFSGGINTDDDSRNVPQGDYRNFEYCRHGNTDGKGFSVIQSAGTVIKENPLITTEDFVVGTAIWQKRNSLVYFILKADNNCQIWRYDIASETHELCAESPAFNWSRDYPIFHSNIPDDLLKITDGRWDDEIWSDEGDRLFNEPQQINLQKSLDGEYPVIDFQTISVIKWPPKPPVVSYTKDDTKADNKLRRKLFRFRYCYIYENNERSVWSLWSNLALPTKSESFDGTNWGDSKEDNCLEVKINTGPNVVKKIEVCVQQAAADTGGAVIPFGTFIQLDKELDGISDNIEMNVLYYGDAALKTVDLIESNTNSYRVPRSARAQEYLPTNEIAYANLREGFDLPELDVEITRNLKEIDWAPVEIGLFSARIINPIPNPEYFSFEVLSLEMTTKLMFYAGQTFSFVYPMPSSQTSTFYFQVTQELMDEAVLAYPSSIINQNRYLTMIIGDAFMVNVGGTPIAPTLPPYNGFGQIITYTNEYDFPVSGVVTVTVLRTTGVVPSLKTGAFHPVGIVYLDDAKREFTVSTNDEMNAFVPFYGQDNTSGFSDPNNPYRVTLLAGLNHLPPKDAKYFCFVGQKSNIIDFCQYVINSDNAVNAIKSEGGRFLIELDKGYLTNHMGVTINHQIQKGDIVRFYRKPLAESWTPNPSAYIEDYFELEVLEYRPTGGSSGRQAIVVEKFDLSMLGSGSTYKGQTIEIYTPRPTMDTDGNLFISEWRDVSPIYEIGEAHTKNRYHKGIITDSGNGSYNDGSVEFTIIGDKSGLVGQYILIRVASGTKYGGKIVDATYNGTNTVLEYNGAPFVGSGLMTWESSLDQFQIVNSGTSSAPAIIELSQYSDVYVRQRSYDTGWNNSNLTSRGWAFYYIEDPHYSDYWLSNYHPFGRLELESSTAKLTHRKASAIHSGVFISDSQINNLSTFYQSVDNVVDLNPVFGEITRVFLSGREQKTLKLLQPNKENSIYIQNYPTDVNVPTGELKITDKTFASTYPYKELYGCSSGGSAAITPEGSVMYFDVINGLFIFSSSGGSRVVSEIDPISRTDFKFRKKTKELTDRVRNDEAAIIRSFVNPIHGEVGFAFSFNNETEFDIVVFDYLKMRWRSEYRYNFRWFETFGNRMYGFGKNNQIYSHNQDNSINFHGDTFTSVIKFVSNHEQMLNKRFMNILTRADRTFDLVAQTDYGLSYDVMETTTPSWLWVVREDFSYAYYRKNKYSKGYASEEMAMINGEDIRAQALTNTLSYTPKDDRDKFVLSSVEIDGVFS